ncbi:MAG: hypothetical protein HZA46_16910 [Planctomycetales bacterium]|nr:hypothetical protein [Planctomycetales bacterium]
MKTVVYRGGVVTFRIPMEWVEEYDDYRGGTFYGNAPNAGTLRLQITTMATDRLVTADFVFTEATNVSPWARGGHPSDVQRYPNGNTVVRYSKKSFSWFKRIVIHFWEVYNPVPPHHMRIALFSYTILKSRESDRTILQELEFLDGEIRAAEFYSEVGQ